MDIDILNEIRKKKPELLATRRNEKKQNWFVDDALLERIKSPDWKGWEAEPKDITDKELE